VVRRSSGSAKKNGNNLAKRLGGKEGVSRKKKFLGGKKLIKLMQKDRLSEGKGKRISLLRGV